MLSKIGLDNSPPYSRRLFDSKINLEKGLGIVNKGVFEQTLNLMLNESVLYTSHEILLRNYFQ